MSCADPLRDGRVAYTPGLPCPDRVVSDEEAWERWEAMRRHPSQAAPDCRDGWHSSLAWYHRYDLPDPVSGGRICVRCGRVRYPANETERHLNSLEYDERVVRLTAAADGLGGVL